MSIYNEIKKALATTVDVIVDKTTTQAQKSRLITVMNNEEKIANQVYVELGKYLYRNLREEVPEDVQQLCTKLDQSKERMSRAQQIYREVIQQELVNREISKSEAKDSFRKIKDPIVTKAKDTAVKVKDTAVDTAAKVKGTAKETAVKVKDTAVERAEELKNKTHKPAEEISEEAAVEIETTEVIVPEVQQEEDIAKPEEIVEPIETREIVTESAEVLTVGQGLSNNVEVIENAIFSDSPLSEESVSETEAEDTNEVFSDSETVEEKPASEAEDVEESFVPETDTVDQEFQRNVPVDIISEHEFEQDEPEIKPVDKNNPISKAMKLKNIITKKNTDEK